MVSIIVEGPVRYTHHGAPNFRNYTDWQLFVNRGWRDATLLAVSGFEFLFEYEQGFKTYLVEIGLDVSGVFDWHSLKSVNRNRMSKKWQLAEWFAEVSR